MKLHPRFRIVEKADMEFRTHMNGLIIKHDLTYGEVCRMLGDYICQVAKYIIRGERHPDDPEKKGDEA